MESLLALIKEAVEEKKAIDPVILNLQNISNVTDYFLICSGKNAVQVRSIADNIVDKMGEAAIRLPLKEGYHEGRWVLLDFGNVVVHIMQEAERDFYALENLWHDAKILN